MPNLPIKPNGSIIAVKNERNCIELSWKNPRGGLGRYANILFLLIWFIVWSFAGMSIFFSMKDPKHFSVLIGLLVWLCGEFLGMRGLYLLARPTRPEKITLALLNLEFEPGTSNDDPILDKSEGWFRRILSLFRQKNKWIIDKKDIGEIKLVHVGERQRLTFDVGADRIEVGAYLREPEREWLYEFLKAWKEGKSN